MKKFEEISLDINLVIQGFKTDDGISEQQLETLFKQFQQVLNRLSAISFRSTEMREDLVKVAAPPPQSPLDDEQGVTDDMVGISSLPSRELTPPSQDGENSTDSLLQENGIGPSSCEAASEVQQKGVLSDTFKVLLKSKILVVQAANGALSSKIDRRKESSEIAEAKEKVQNSLKQMRELLDQGKEQLEGMQDGDDKDCWQALFDQMEAKCLEQENLFKKYCEV